MAKLDFNHVLRIAVVTLSLVFLAVLAIVWVQGARTEHLTMAASASSGESYLLGQALKTAVRSSSGSYEEINSRSMAGRIFVDSEAG